MSDVAVRLRLLATEKVWLLLRKLHAEWEQLGKSAAENVALDRERTLEIYLLHGLTIAELKRRGWSDEEIIWALDNPRA